MKITFLNQEYDVTLREEKYQGGRLAIVAFAPCLLDDNDPESMTMQQFGTVTTNLPNEELNDGEFFVRTWSEGVWVKQLLAAGVFEDTRRTVESGFVVVPVWRRGPKYSEVLERRN